MMKFEKTCLIFLFFLWGCSSVTTSNLQSSSIKEERFQENVKIGMTKEDVLASWGTPDKIMKKQGKDFDEIWIYIPHWKFKNYLYFRNGILVRGDPDPEDLI